MVGGVFNILSILSYHSHMIVDIIIIQLYFVHFYWSVFVLLLFFDIPSPPPEHVFPGGQTKSPDIAFSRGGIEYE